VTSRITVHTQQLDLGLLVIDDFVELEREAALRFPELAPAAAGRDVEPILGRCGPRFDRAHIALPRQHRSRGAKRSIWSSDTAL
jgi:hypothetical protein